MAVSLVLGITACTSDQAPEDTTPIDREVGAIEEPDAQAQAGGQLVYGLVAESVGWNPTNTIWGSSGLTVSHALFDRLAAFDDAGDARPDLAEDITSDPGFTRWTIRLRPGVTLHDGQPVTAALVAAGLDVFRASPTTAAMLAPVQAVEAVGDLEVLVTMSAPWVDFADTLTTQVGIVADPAWLASGSPVDPIGTGPFVYDEWQPNHRLTTHRNPGYWRVDPTGVPLPYLDGVTFEPISDSDVRAAKLQAGYLDIMQTDSADQLERFQDLDKDSPLQVFDDVAGESPEVFVQLNTAVTPFSDPDARRALVLGTDTTTYVEVLERDLYEPARGPFDPNSPWFAETDYPDYDPAAARTLLETVAPRLGGDLSFTVLGSTDPHTLSALQLLQEQWKNVGITVRIEVVDPAQLAQRVAVGTYQAVLWEQFDGPQPTVDVVQWDPAAAAPLALPALNSARNVDPLIGEAITSLRAASDNAQRKVLWGTVQQRLAADLPYVWLLHGTRGVIADEDIVNVVHYLLPGGETGIELDRGTHPLWQVWRSH